MARIGQILSESVPLSDHDVEEILNEQKSTRQRFGDAALALGKARPDQVWDAWLSQLRDQPVDLSRFSPDPAAVSCVPSSLALRIGFVPLRIRGNQLVIAAASELSADDKWAIERDCGVRLVVAQAPLQAVSQALSRLYPALAA
ncbi:MAG: type secretion system protein GspE [Phycisphaerales bacterium]|nr:type secretion system protein GspE [Phycisphaerales bacterium]